MSGAVIIRRCASAEEAAIVCALLNDAGIEAWLDNWYHATADWGSLLSLNGVGVRVPASRYEEARRVIIDYSDNAAERLLSEFPDLDFCPLHQNRLRAHYLLILYTVLVCLPLVLFAVLMRTAFGVDGYATTYEYYWLPVGLHTDRAYELLGVLYITITLAPFLALMTAIVLLGRRFLKQRAKQKQPT